MTPLEELQAAHKRLSELQNTATAPGWWAVHAGENTRWHDIRDSADNWLAEVDSVEVSNLIVTLHRTIDAQLALLRSAISLAECNLTWNGRANQWYRLESGNDHMLLARAINGGSDDAA